MENERGKPVALPVEIWDFKPHRLYSLADMNEFFGYRFFALLSELEEEGYNARDKGSEISTPEDGERIRQLLGKLFTHCHKLNLRGSLTNILHFGSRLGVDTPPFTAIELALSSLRHSLVVELNEIKFCFVPLEKSAYFERESLFGEEVSKAFPSAKSEIKDAGNCLAMDLHTAAVFHLMRTAEHGLRGLALELGVTLKYQIEYEDWGSVIGAIESQLKGLPSRNPSGEELLQFYRGLVSDCNYFKDVWRNPAMHTRVRFEEEGAMGLYKHVRDFMKRLSERVKESK